MLYPLTRNRQRRQDDTIRQRRSHRRKNHAATAPATETIFYSFRIRLDDNAPHPAARFACHSFPRSPSVSKKRNPSRMKNFFGKNL